MKSFLQRWMIMALAVFVATSIVDGIRADNYPAMALVALLLGVLNAFLRPIMLLLTLPLLLVTLGLFTIIINALLLELVDWMVKPFYVDGFWAAVKGAIVISIVSFLANGIFGKPQENPKNKSTPTPSPSTGGGPVIDV
ncbi:MAG: phage holin family protein [Verrucomicrobiota bacterium]|nr:phage holin family protein [Verrucomicrobiota bacterium]